MRRRYYTCNYYVDDNGLIQKETVEKAKIQIGIYSDDYKVDYVHKETGILRFHFDVIQEKQDKKSRYRQIIPTLYCYKYKKNFDAKYYWNIIKKTLPMSMWIFAKPEDFEKRVISGSVQIFTSKKDYRYKRYYEDKRKQKYAITNKQWKIMLEERLEKDKLLLKEKKRKIKEENDLKILAAGFDLKTSFRN